MLLNTFRAYKLHPKITVPTRITSHCRTCIDNIFTNATKCHAEVLDLCLSDHTCQVIKIPTEVGFKEGHWYMYKRNPDKYLEIFLKYISKISFSDVYSSTDPNYAYEVFTDTYGLIFDLCIPTEKIKMTYKRKPKWKTKGIALASKRKRQLYLQTLKSSSAVVKSEYKKYCKMMKLVMKESKRRTNTNFINKSSNKSKATWQIIKQNTSKVNTLKDTIESIKLNDNVILENSVDIANVMNDFL